MSWSWLRVDPPHAGGLGASCCAGREGGRVQAPALEPKYRAGEFLGSEPGSRSWGFGGDRGPAWRSNQREKKSLTGQMCVL